MLANTSGNNKKERGESVSCKWVVKLIRHWGGREYPKAAQL